MEVKTVNQFGVKSIYIEKNEGEIYVSENYVESPSSAFINGSYELSDYTPTIEPAIPREQVGMIKAWIEREVGNEKSSTLGLLYGKAGIGKSVVMHDLLKTLQENKDYQVLGLKSDQVEFVDTDDLSHKLRLAQPIEKVVEEMAKKFQRVILLIDQIDALSLSLSSNRTPLRSLLKLIGQIQYIPNVRVVISCRPYDLEYDPMLDNLRIKNKWELKELTKEQVSRSLKNNNCNERLSDNLLRFLGNPLHLYLFLKVKSYEKLTDPLTTDLLYNQLWKKYVVDDNERNVDKERLLALLDSIVSSMYERQVLSVHIREFETTYDAELRYLVRNGLAIITSSGQVQFFHQTLFDYVYARLFIENGHDLLEELKAQHQGLFSRAAVKSILTFLRERDSAKYIRIIEKLLYAKNMDGRELYRYHLKSLALNNMAFFEIPLQEELNLISKRVFSDKVYMDVVFETVYTGNWFNAIWNIIDSKGGWKNLSKAYKDKVMVMSQRTLWLSGEMVLDRLNAVLDLSDENDCQYLDDLLQRYNLNCSSDKLIDYYKRLVKTRNPLQYTHLLKSILKENTTFVCEELKENVRQQMKEKKSKYVYKIGVNHEVENLYEELLKDHHDIAIRFLVDILTIVYQSTEFELEGADISYSTEFFTFERVKGVHYVSNVVEDAANILIDGFLKSIDDEKTKRYIMEFSQSKHVGFVYIALYMYTSRPDLFKDDTYDIIMNRQVLANAPSWVEYQAVEALRVTFCLFSDDQKKTILNRILAIEDKDEGKLYVRDTIEIRMKYGHPILDIDIHKGKALEVITLDELRRLSWEAYQERQRIDRKFNKARLKNSKPSSTSSHVGWTSLTVEQGMKMSCDTWFNSMLKYNIDPHDWEKPSLTGQCHLFREVVSKNPDKYVGLIDRAIADERILLDYPQAGMQGLLDAGRMDVAMHVLGAILCVIGNDVNSDVRGFSIHSLLFALNDIPKQDNIPAIVMNLLCNALINAKEPEEDRHKEDKDVHTVGINQARGNAGYMLVECARSEQYKEKIFETIESIAETASIYTRAAILLNMAALNLLDKNRNVELFKRLMHDYNPRLMSLPVHNYNPLVYFINYAVGELMDYFEHAANCPACYPGQVVILWLAWSHNHRDERIKVLLDKMCDNSEEARISLLKFLSTLDQKVNDDGVCYILHIMEPLFDSQKMGEACDNLFYHIGAWPEKIQYQITDRYVNSPLCKHHIHTFVGYLGGYAIKDPVQTLRWLELMMDKAEIPDDYFIWNRIADVIIQAYNGIKSFNDPSYQETLEHAMDLIDTIMKSPNNKHLISNFINKLDNE